MNSNEQLWFSFVKNAYCFNTPSNIKTTSWPQCLFSTLKNINLFPKIINKKCCQNIFFFKKIFVNNTCAAAVLTDLILIYLGFLVKWEYFSFFLLFSYGKGSNKNIHQHDLYDIFRYNMYSYFFVITSFILYSNNRVKWNLMVPGMESICIFFSLKMCKYLYVKLCGLSITLPKFHSLMFRENVYSLDHVCFK